MKPSPIKDILILDNPLIEEHDENIAGCIPMIVLRPTNLLQNTPTKTPTFWGCNGSLNKKNQDFLKTTT